MTLFEIDRKYLLIFKIEQTNIHRNVHIFVERLNVETFINLGLKL